MSSNVNDSPRKSLEPLRKKRLSVNPFQSIMADTNQATLDVSVSSPRAPNDRLTGNIDDIIVAASNAGKRYSYLLQDAR
jgi:hypothetical protein